MRIKSLLIILGIAFCTTFGYAACTPCGCYPAHEPADHTSITVVNWPATTITLHMCCENTTITAEELYGMLGLGGIFGVDGDDFIHNFEISHTNPCWCESSHTMLRVDNRTSVTWSGEINCDTGGGAVTAHFFNDEEVYCELGPGAECTATVLISTPDTLDMTLPVEIIQDVCEGRCCGNEHCPCGENGCCGTEHCPCKTHECPCGGPNPKCPCSDEECQCVYPCCETLERTQDAPSGTCDYNNNSKCRLDNTAPEDAVCMTRLSFKECSIHGDGETCCVDDDEGKILSLGCGIMPGSGCGCNQVLSQAPWPSRKCVFNNN